MKFEFKTFITALTFFTRIPVAKWGDYSEASMNRSSGYFSLVGILVGLVAAMVFWLCNLVLPVSVSVLLSTGASILLTGGFHEDAFADVCDAFGGGWNKERILEIMKDSCIGAYGTLGMVMMVGTKIFSLTEVPVWHIPFTIICAHSLSRLATVHYLFTHEYVTDNDKSKSKPMAKKISISRLLFALITGIAPLLLFWNPWVFIVIIPVFIAKVWMASYFKKWVGGYTGDCLGSVQQVCEVCVYISMVILSTHLM